VSAAEVVLWGTRVGAVAMRPGERAAVFEYAPEFLRSGIELAPLKMPLRAGPHRFPGLAAETFHGLPGLLADSLPDRFGQALIDAWLAEQGRAPDSFDAVERLSYVGRRGMGALEYRPALGPRTRRAKAIDVAALVDLASRVLGERGALRGSLAGEGREAAVRDILLVGTSAGGARAKALIAWNPVTGEVRSGQLDTPPGFEHWLLKFDGVSGNADRELADPQGYGLIELAYARMAVAAGIEMGECRLLAEGGRHHFMTRRFDRPGGPAKLHMQSLGALAHLDYNQAGAAGYEQALMVVRRLGLGMDALEEQFRRMVFNIVARNQDDHVKNIAFLMDRDGRWSLSPAFDLTYAYRPGAPWTGQHQMSVNGRRDGFTREDLDAAGRTAGLGASRPGQILEQVTAAVRRWPDLASEAGVPPERAGQIARTHRTALARR
jgi:serine/threonine-protein kinase HipA